MRSRQSYTNIKNQIIRVLRTLNTHRPFFNHGCDSPRVSSKKRKNTCILKAKSSMFNKVVHNSFLSLTEFYRRRDGMYSVRYKCRVEKTSVFLRMPQSDSSVFVFDKLLQKQRPSANGTAAINTIHQGKHSIKRSTSRSQHTNNPPLTCWGVNPQRALRGFRCGYQHGRYSDSG